MPKKQPKPAPGRLYGGESADERLARQRQQFMDAGLELFGTIGYRATTVRLLCRQSGLIDRYFYKNFADTEALLAAVYRESMDTLQAQVMAAVAAAPPDDAEALIAAGLEAFFVAFENSRMARVCWLEVLGVSPAIDALYMSNIRRFAQLLIGLARSLVPNWSVPEDEADILGVALIGAISQSAMHWLLGDYRTPRRTLVTATRKLVGGAMAVLAPSAPAAATAKTRSRPSHGRASTRR